MNDSQITRANAWNAFWFSPSDGTRLARVRGLLCLITAGYFISSWSDVSFWYAADGPLSNSRVAHFIQVGGLEDAARWIVSPLFFVDSIWVYRLYLVIAVALCGLVATGRGGRVAGFTLWLMFVGWANRAMILSGLPETMISLGLFASAIAPASACWIHNSDQVKIRRDWTNRFSQRLMATQITVIAVATFITMLSGRVWLNGIGAYALAAPAPDRTIDWTNSSWFIQGGVHETLTHLIVIALPLGTLLAWVPRTNRIGQCVLLLWSLSIALLGSHWLYAATFAVMTLAIQPEGDEPELTKQAA